MPPDSALGGRPRPQARVDELGSKSPNIVFDDANMDHAVKGVIAGIFAATGQTCIAGRGCWCSRFTTSSSTAAGVREDGAMGNPMLRETQIGPITNQPQLAKVLAYIDIAKAEAQPRPGGGRSSRPECGEAGSSADHLHRRQQPDADRAGRGVRPGVVGDPVDGRRRRSPSATTWSTVAAGVWTQNMPARC